jgi:uncharacterized membrane protein
MTLGMAESFTLLILSVFAIIILVKILLMVHKQASKVKELEMRMKAFEKFDEPNEVTTEE